MVVGIVFLGLSLAKGKTQKQNSVEISNLLESAMYYTSDCAINYVPQYREGQDLIKDCFKDPEQKCLNGKKVCEALNDTIVEIIGISLMVDEKQPRKGYKLIVYYNPSKNQNSESTENILSVEKGSNINCTSRTGGSHSIAVGAFSSGTINTELEVCEG